ncbi:MAG: hypothetical protein ACK4OP_15075 [Gemmobacter sp.]
MTKHIADRRAPSAGTRVAAFAAIARREGGAGSHPSTQAILRRPQGEQSPTKVAHYLRIARGREA